MSICYCIGKIGCYALRSLYLYGRKVSRQTAKVRGSVVLVIVGIKLYSVQPLHTPQSMPKYDFVIRIGGC